jgi:cysteine-rich repeat protein
MNGQRCRFLIPSGLLALFLLSADIGHATKVDFLWVIDNSPSMADEQAILSSVADDIDGQLANAICPIDWRMAVAYTDMQLPSGPNDVCPGAPGPGRRRLCPFTRDIDVFKNGTPECAYVRPGTCGDGTERGFLGTRIAIDRFQAGSGCEPVPGGECSLRSDARLAVIYFSDTGEQTSNRNPPPGQPDNSVASWAGYFGDYDLLTPGAQRAQVHGILCPARPAPGDTTGPCSDGLLDPALYDRYSQVIDQLGGTEGSIRDDKGSRLSDTIKHIVDAAIAGACCGDGIIEPGEQCDDGNTEDGDCCSSSCRFEPATAVCRTAAGPCDAAEFCPGSSPTCPADALRPAGFECRGTAGACDLPEFCSGTTAACPVDGFKPATVECRSTAGPCDTAEMCTGTGPRCPADAFRPATVECRPAAGGCDAPEACTGVDAQCPDDGKRVGICRPATGPCDQEERCDGSSNDCPADALIADGTACDDANACTESGTCRERQCVGGNPLQGAAAFACICDHFERPSCTGQTVPRAVSHRFERACSLLARSHEVRPGKARQLATKAAKALRKAGKIATRSGRRQKISTACAVALADTIGDLKMNAQQLSHLKKH